MAIVINIEDYRKKKDRRHSRKSAREQEHLIDPLETWHSEEEQIRYHMEKAEKDLAEWEQLYPVIEEYAE